MSAVPSPLRPREPVGQKESAGLAELLHAEVSIGAPASAEIRGFVHFEGARIGVLGASGDPMRITNGVSCSDQVYLVALRRGRSAFRHSEGESSVESGQFVVFQGSRELEIVHQQAFEVIGIRLQLEALARRLPEWQHVEFMPLEIEAEGALLLQAAAELLRCGSKLQLASVDVTTDWMIRLLAEILAAKCQSAKQTWSDQPGYQLRRIKQYCRTHLHSTDLNVPAIAQAVGLSAAHVHRVFASEPLTLMAWIQRERLAHCHRAIEEDRDRRRSLTEIALASGFKDFAHFSHSFKRQFGLSPSELRKDVLAVECISATALGTSLGREGQTSARDA